MSEYNFNVFYCTACHVCKKILIGPEVMKVCSGCRLVQYCGHAHQKKDWLNHKQLCRAVQHIVKRTGTNHLFKEAYEFNKEDFLSWNRLRASIIKLVELILKRSLTPVESQILLFPLLCHYCFRYQVNSMFACGSCNSVMYCSLEHKNNDKNHNKNCKLLGLSFTLDLKRFFNQNTISKLSTYINELSVLKELGLPQDIESLPLPIQVTSANDFVQFSEILSYPLTLIFAIQKVNKFSSSKLTIHMVGADAMEISSIETLLLFFYLIPYLSHLKIIMIGPNTSSLQIPAAIPKNCEVDKVNKLYHEYVIGDCYIHPDVIAVFNSGFCEHVDEPEKDIWKFSLTHISNINNSLVVLTSYTTQEANIDFKRLCEMMNKQHTFENVLECQLNPFGSLYPHRDWENYGCLFYVNKYISILNM